MRLVHAGVAVALALGLYVALAMAAPGLASDGPAVEALRAQGLLVERPAASVAFPLAAAAPPALVVLAQPAGMPAGEQDALLDAVRAGATLWLVVDEASRAPDLAEAAGAAAPRAFSGPVFGRSGGAAPVDSAAGRAEAVGLRALDVRAGWEAVATTSDVTFRDANGNGRLDGGEPAGPFVVAAAAAVGDGRVVVLGAESLDALPPALVAHLAATLPAGEAVVLDGAVPGAWARAAKPAVAVLSLPAVNLLAALVVAVASLAAAALLLPRGAEPASAKRRTVPDLAAPYRRRLAGRPDAQARRMLELIPVEP